MDTISHEFVSTLIKAGTPCVSLYLPTLRTGDALQQNRIRYKNLLSEANERLERTRPAGAQVLEQATSLADDQLFWSKPSDGVAVFCTPGAFHAFRLPVSFESSVHIGRPYIKPLLSLLAENGAYHLLAVSENRARLFYGSRFELAEVELDSLPKNLGDVLREHTESQMLVHTGQPALKDKESRVFYGVGGVDVQRSELESYFREIDRVLTPYLRSQGEETLLVFCGVEYLFPIFREVTTYTQLHDQPVAGNCDRATTSELLAKANEVLAPYWTRQRRLDEQRLQDRIGSSVVTADIESILSASHDGKVEVLFVANDAELEGTYNLQTRVCGLGDQSSASEDVLNVAAAETLVRGGRAYAVKANEIPAGLLVSALFRYA